MIRTLSNLARTKFPGREFPPRRPFGEVAPNLAASLEVWPAAGGGLLLGMNVLVLAGAAPRRQPVKSLFLRVDTQCVARVIVPYARLEAGVARRVSEMMSAKLGVSSGRVAVDNRTAGQRSASEHGGDLCRSVEASLVLPAAVARSLMIIAAAELRKAAIQDCLVKRYRPRPPLSATGVLRRPGHACRSCPASQLCRHQCGTSIRDPIGMIVDEARRASSR